MTRRFVPALAVIAVVLAACGGSDSSETTATDAPADTTAVTEPVDEFTEDSVTLESTTAETTAEPAAETTAAPPAETVADAVPTTEQSIVEDTTPAVGENPASGVAVTLDEWLINAPTEYIAGEVTFTATNAGGFPHEFVVIQGESYIALPLEDGGAVIEEDLPTGALLGRTDRIAGGSSEELTVTLAPGNYVLVCNLGGGANSHAGQGQRLDITVV